MAHGCRVEPDLNPLRLELVGGPESRGLLSALSRGFGLLQQVLQRVIDVLVNVEIIANPEAFVFLRAPTGVDITPGSAQEVAKNDSTTPVVVYVRAETYGVGNAGHLILDSDLAKTTLARARVVKHGVAPEAKAVLEPSARLYADVTDSSGGAQASFRVTATVVPFSGAAILGAR